MSKNSSDELSARHLPNFCKQNIKKKNRKIIKNRLEPTTASILSTVIQCPNYVDLKSYSGRLIQSSAEFASSLTEPTNDGARGGVVE